MKKIIEVFILTAIFMFVNYCVSVSEQGYYGFTKNTTQGQMRARIAGRIELAPSSTTIDVPSIVHHGPNKRITVRDGATVSTMTPHGFYGDGSNLINVVQQTEGSSVTVNNIISATRYDVDGSTFITKLLGTGSMRVGFTIGPGTNSGEHNTFLGTGTGDVNNIAGTNHTFVGYRAGKNVNTGSGNTFVGSGSGHNRQLGSNNTFTGKGSGEVGANGTGNTFTGYESGNQTAGHYNTFFGYKTGDSLTSGNSNIIIGYDEDTPTATSSNYLNIGGLIVGDMSTSSITVLGKLNANEFHGDGNNLTNLDSDQLDGTIPTGLIDLSTVTTALSTKVDFNETSSITLNVVQVSSLVFKTNEYATIFVSNSQTEDLSYVWPSSAPTEGEHLCSDNDGNMSWCPPDVYGIQEYYLTGYPEFNGYKLMTATIPTQGYTSTTMTITASDVEVSSFVTPSGYPANPNIPQGTWITRIHGYVDSTAGKLLSIYAKVYEVESDESENLIGTTDNSATFTTSPGGYSLYLSTNTLSLEDNSRISIKYYTVLTDAGNHSNPELYAIRGGDYHSRVALPGPAVNIANVIPYTGATDNVDLGAYNITATEFHGDGSNLTALSPSEISAGSLDGDVIVSSAAVGLIDTTAHLGDMNCADDEILKWNDGAGTWGCESDGGEGFVTEVGDNTFTGPNEFQDTVTISTTANFSNAGSTTTFGGWIDIGRIAYIYAAAEANLRVGCGALHGISGGCSNAGGTLINNYPSTETDTASAQGTPVANEGTVFNSWSCAATGSSSLTAYVICGRVK